MKIPLWNKNEEFDTLPFYDETTTNTYVYSAISCNIQNSLKHYQRGGHFRMLQNLYNKNELTKAINRIVENMNHLFLAEIITKDFVSNDLHIVFDVGEYDMAIYDKSNYCIELFEIKHSDKIVSNQSRNLRNEELLKLVEMRFNSIVRKCVLYQGKNTVDENGIEYKNVNEFLCE